MKIHPMAAVSPLAMVAPDVEIGPFCVVEAGATIGPGCKLESHVVVKRGTTLGEGNTVHEGAILGGLPQLARRIDQPGGLHIGTERPRWCVPASLLRPGRAAAATRSCCRTATSSAARSAWRPGPLRLRSARPPAPGIRTLSIASSAAGSSADERTDTASSAARRRNRTVREPNVWHPKSSPASPRPGRM